MEENTNLENQNNEQNEQVETISMSKTDYDKAIQSAEDKLRTNYSKQIKDFEKKIAELTPAQKTETELALEKRLAEVEAKEKRLNLIDTITSKNLDKSMVDFLKDDVDIDSFEKTISNIVSQRMAASGYNPTNHQNNESISVEKWKAMSYSEKQKIYETNPELAKRFMNTK